MQKNADQQTKHVTYGESVYFLDGEYTITDLKKLIESEKTRTKMLDESMRKVDEVITEGSHPKDIDNWESYKLDKQTNK